MSVVKSVAAVNPDCLVEQFHQVVQFVQRAARTGDELMATEDVVLSSVMALGCGLMSLFFALQGNGDVGESVEVEGKVLTRSDDLHKRDVRTVFGEHSFDSYVYGHNLDKKIEFRPIDVRMLLPEGKFSPKFCEISHILFSEQAFERTSKTLQSIFGQPIAASSLERISEKIGVEAENFLHEVPSPASQDEGEILVVSGDGKGVPMIRETVAKHAAFEKREYPGNRKMATLATVYSVDRFVRTPQQIVEALFRDNMENPKPQRPEPIGKVVVGCMTRMEGDEPIPGDIQAFTWGAEQVKRRHQAKQPIVRLMDGQVSLWETASICLEERPTTDILDIIHVSSYVWAAAKIFHPYREGQEWFTRDRLERILNGDVAGVISGLRQMSTKQKLCKADKATIERVCGYFEKNRYRMKYDEYLREGYPIATGVIEGACRHLVMDRMCRTGMRWGTTGSQAMLHNRAVNQAGLTTEFHAYRGDQERQKTKKFAQLLKGYQPHTLCG